MQENKYAPKVEERDLGDGKSLKIVDHRAYLDPSEGLERSNESKEGGVESYDMVDAKGKIAFHVKDKLAYLKDDVEKESARVGSNPDASNDDVLSAQESEREVIIKGSEEGESANNALEGEGVVAPESVESSEVVEAPVKPKVAETPAEKPAEPKTVEAPAEIPVEKPAESKTVEAPAEIPVEKPETILTKEPTPIESHYEKSIDESDQFARLNELKTELAGKEKELLDLADADENSTMFKDLFKPRAIKKMLKRMRGDLAEDIQRLKEEIETELARIEFKKVLTQLYIDLENAKTGLEKARMSAKPMETAFYENEIKRLEKEISEIEKLLDGGMVNKIKSVWESFKNSDKWGFIKERAKGILTFGYWEFHQAEKFRSGTNKVAKNIDRQTTEQEALVKEEARPEDKANGIEAHRLGLGAALKEAGEIKNTFEISGNNNPDASQYEELSQQISNRKREENDLLIDGITERAINEIIKRLETSSKLQGYRTSHEGKSVITPERLEIIKQKIKESLNRLRFKQEVDDIKTYKAMIRENLDPKWWTRYIYGGLETILGSIALKLILTQTPATAPMGIGHTTGVGPIDPGINDAYLKDTVWGEAKRFLASHGISNPSNAQILEASKTISSESGVIVPEWGIQGSVLHTKMQAGYLLKMGGVFKKLAAIKALI